MESTFEELLNEYKDIAKELNSEDIDLDRAIDLYEKSNEIYKLLNAKINDATQRIIDLKNDINE